MSSAVVAAVAAAATVTTTVRKKTKRDVGILAFIAVLVLDIVVIAVL